MGCQICDALEIKEGGIFRQSRQRSAVEIDWLKVGIKAI